MVCKDYANPRRVTNGSQLRRGLRALRILKRLIDVGDGICKWCYDYLLRFNICEVMSFSKARECLREGFAVNLRLVLVGTVSWLGDMV